MAETSDSKLAIIICCHDAGGANQLYYWCLRWRSWFDLNIVAQGPAVTIFNKSFSVSKKLDVVLAADIVITGSGWQSSFEVEALLKARAQSIPSVTFLDHWSNYSSRFNYKNDIVLPDKIWVADHYAKKKVDSIRLFDGIPIRMIGNPFWQALKFEVSGGSCSDKSLLIAHEPIRNEFTDSTVLAGDVASFLKNDFANYSIIFRMHPSGPDDFSDFLLNELVGFNVEISEDTIADDLSRVAVVLGYQTALLPLAATLGKKAISFLPAEQPSVLLHEEINYCFK